MRISIDGHDRRKRTRELTESVRRSGLPSDPMEIAKLLGIGDGFAELVRRGRRRVRGGRETGGDDEIGKDAVGR